MCKCKEPRINHTTFLEVVDVSRLPCTNCAERGIIRDMQSGLADSIALCSVMFYLLHRDTAGGWRGRYLISWTHPSALLLEDRKSFVPTLRVVRFLLHGSGSRLW
jgi:hypothetical protein